MIRLKLRWRPKQRRKTFKKAVNYLYLDIFLLAIFIGIEILKDQLKNS